MAYLQEKEFLEDKAYLQDKAFLEEMACYCSKMIIDFLANLRQALRAEAQKLHLAK
jgi:hypothetical protein